MGRQPIPAARKGSFGRSMKAVMWSFFGVRRGRDHERDMTGLNPVHIVIAALICFVCFIGILLTVVHFVTH